jgi:glycosyltransferase involved in cell wall biosynthesis
MRIAFVLEEARIDGTVRFVSRQVNRLVRRGHEVAVVSAPGALEAELSAAEVTLVNALSPGSGEMDDSDLTRLRNACAGADLVVAAAGRAFPAAVAARPKSRIILDVLSNDLFVGDAESTVAAVRDAARAGNIVAHALTDARAHAERYGFALENVRFVPLPVERPVYDAALDRSHFATPHELLVLTAARLDDDHVAYFRPLFEGIESLRRSGYPVRLLVVGGGTHAEALARAAPPDVTFLGFRQDLDALYPLADVYVGEGSTRLEAALAGVPVISSCAQEFPELAGRALFLFGMQHGTLHTYMPSTAVVQTPFAEALELLFEHPVLRSRIAARGRERVATEHRPDVYVSFLERLAAGEDLPRGARIASPPVRVLQVRAERSAILEAARTASRDVRLAIELDRPLSWAEYAALPEDVWDSLADATRYAALHASGDHLAKPRPLSP